MVKIAVCEDEKNIRDYLVALIKKQGRECSIAEYACADAYWADGKEYDLLFLDIEVDGAGIGMNGMELARDIRGKTTRGQPIIIFVTGYEKYVYDAFDVGAFQYLVKPVDERKFAQVFGRAVDQILSEQRQPNRKLVVPFAGEVKVISLDDIYYIESQNHKVMLCLKHGGMEYYEKIGELENELKGQFYRIHRGYLVNLLHVEGYDRVQVRMVNGDKLLISRYKYEGFVQAYMKYISEEIR